MAIHTFVDNTKDRLHKAAIRHDTKNCFFKNPYLFDETTANSYKKHFQKFSIFIIKKDLAIFSKPKYFRKNI